MTKNMFNKILLLAVMVISFFSVSPVNAADITVMTPPGQPYGAHEIWAHSQMGQSFVAVASNVRAGFYVVYSPESAALMAPNAPVTDLVVSLYQGENLDSANLLNQKTITVDTTMNGYLDVSYVTSGNILVPGNVYTLGISSPSNRGWIIPSVCDFQNLDASGQPSGAYTSGHPFFNGQITLDETNICDNAFHVIEEIGGSVVVTPTPTTVSPTPTVVIPTPTISKERVKKIEITGFITKVSSSSITVKNMTVNITASTKLQLNYQSSLLVGQKVYVKGIKNADGTVSASYIEVIR